MYSKTNSQWDSTQINELKLFTIAIFSYVLGCIHYGARSKQASTSYMSSSRKENIKTWVKASAQSKTVIMINWGTLTLNSINTKSVLWATTKNPAQIIMLIEAALINIKSDI